MDMKTLPEDFIVEEIYDIENFKQKQENRSKPYYYFILTKTDYNQIKAIEKIARIFNTSRKLVHFAGTKDKVGITKQVISVYGINEDNFEKNLQFLNNNVDDLQLEYVGKFDGRINLGDNLGNRFTITIRNLEQADIKLAKANIEKIRKQGVLNYFDEQRFGYANNSHIIGMHILKNEVELAVKTILTSLPQNPKDNHKKFAEEIEQNWEEIKNQNQEIINQIIEIAPTFLKSEMQILEHLKKYKNDFPGAFRKIHKKIRTLYINAYQSYLFNETIKELNNNNQLDNYKELDLILEDTKLKDKIIQQITKKFLDQDNLLQENFKLKSMPELKFNPAKRQTRVFPKNIKIVSEENDDLNKDKQKLIITFELGKGEYATNVIKQIFEK